MAENNHRYPHSPIWNPDHEAARDVATREASARGYLHYLAPSPRYEIQDNDWYRKPGLPVMPRSKVNTLTNQKPLTLPPSSGYPGSLSHNEWSEIYGSAMETKGGATSSSVNRIGATHLSDDYGTIRSPIEHVGWSPTPTNSHWGASPKDYWANTPTNSPVGWGTLGNYDDYSTWYSTTRPQAAPSINNHSANTAASRLGLVSLEQQMSQRNHNHTSSLTLQSYPRPQTSGGEKHPLTGSSELNKLATPPPPALTFAEKGPKRKGKEGNKGGKGEKKVKAQEISKKGGSNNNNNNNNNQENEASPNASNKEIITRYETAIYRCAKERNWQRAVKKLRDMQTEMGVPPTVRAYTSAISACAKVGQSATARYLLAEMKKADVKPNVLTYSAVISACEKGRKCRQAMQLLEEMRESGVEPDVITYNAVISACEKARKWKLAIDVLEEMKTRGVKPDVITYSAAISACEKGAKLDYALELLQNLKNDGLKPDVILYNAVISACDKRGDWQKVGQILTEMESSGVKPDVISYSTAISACDRGKNLDFASQILSKMKQENLIPNNIAYTAIIRAAERDGKMEFAEQMKQEMKSHGLTPIVSKGKQPVEQTLNV